MKISIENIKLSGVIGVLDKLNLKGMKSIHRTRLSKAISENLQRIAEEEKQLKKEHCNLDDDGEPIIIEGKYDIKDMNAFRTAMDEFFDEKVIIDGGDSQTYLKSVKKSLEESEIDWQGKEAYSYADLYEAFEGEESE